ncbi:transcriptional regulator [Shewanella sp. Shew256]|uniref:transcriptional regulator n=1 Tax=Shewanella sp. Shew256 TaxID=1969376 RepID=UPI000B499AF5|nr:transcriptional regulator [Shewanella sp. Shew256]
MQNQETTAKVSTLSESNNTVIYRMPYELFNDNLGQTMFEISRMPLVDGLLLGGRESLAKALVKRCGYSLRTARRHIKRLEISGLLISTEYQAPSRLKGVSLYSRLFD